MPARRAVWSTDFERRNSLLHIVMRNGTSDVAAHSPASSGQGEPRIDLSLCEHQQHGRRFVPAGPPRLRPRVKTRTNAFVTDFHPVQWTQRLPGCGPLSASTRRGGQALCSSPLGQDTTPSECDQAPTWVDKRLPKRVPKPYRANWWQPITQICELRLGLRTRRPQPKQTKPL